MGEERKKCGFLETHLSLNAFQFKLSRYNLVNIHEPHGNHRAKLTKDTQKINIK